MARSSALEWSLVQAFLAVAEHGSLSAAARSLGLSQPTLGRQVRAMEEQLGAELFQRHEKGLSLTELGDSLIASARAMRDAAHGIELRAAGQGERLEGTVRITASVVVALHHLPAIAAQIRSKEPQIAIEIVPSDETSNLHYREADIAIRMYRPQQLDLVTQHVGDLSIGVFASRGYVERRGMPQTREELLDHEIVGMDRNTQIIDGFRAGGLEVTREIFGTRTDDSATYWALVRAGCGIGFSQRAVGCKDPDLVEIPLPLGLPKLPVWLTAHDAVRRAPRVHRVWTLLAEGLRRVVDP
jgi:DNA-binding transcriptional LysR family regulator